MIVKKFHLIIQWSYFQIRNRREKFTGGVTRWLENFEEERKVESWYGDMWRSTAEHNRWYSHRWDYTKLWGQSKKQNKTKTHQNIKGQNSSLSKLGEGGIKAFRRLHITKSLNSLSAKDQTLRNKFYLLCLYFTSYIFCLFVIRFVITLIFKAQYVSSLINDTLTHHSRQAYITVSCLNYLEHSLMNNGSEKVF